MASLQSIRSKNTIILLVNLGTPSSLKRWDIMKYLFEFLMDPCVIDIPFPLRLFLVGGIIVPTRSPQTQAAYREVWKEESPLLTISLSQAKKLAEKTGHPTEVVMRYGEPSFKRVFKQLEKVLVEQKAEGLQETELVIIPLYPHAALSTTETVYRQIDRYLPGLLKKTKKKGITIRPRTIKPFYQHSEYRKVLSDSIKPFSEEIKKNKNHHLLFSYHGVPERHIRKTDFSDQGKPGSHCLLVEDCCNRKKFPDHPAHEGCYLHQTKLSTEMVVADLNLDLSQVSHAYQSRLGKDPWLTPYADQTIVELAKQGVKKLWVVCPAFVSDNLETLFEIQIENQELFQEHGGEEIILIPCLNDRSEFIDFLQHVVE